MSWQAQQLRWEITKLNKHWQEREQELLTINPQAQNFLNLEKERNDIKKDAEAMDEFFREECGFASYQDAREKLDGQTVPQILQKLQISREVIQSLKTDLANQEKKQLKKAQKTTGTQTDLTDKQVRVLVQQWEQVAQWAQEVGINTNQNWNLGTLKKKFQHIQQAQPIFNQLEKLVEASGRTDLFQQNKKLIQQLLTRLKETMSW